LLYDYRASYGFGQAIFPNDGSVLGLRQFFDTARAASKNNAPFNSGQNQPKNNHLALLI